MARGPIYEVTVQTWSTKSSTMFAELQTLEYVLAREQRAIAASGKRGTVQLEVHVVAFVDRVEAELLPQTLSLFQSPVHGRDINRKTE